MAINLKYYEDTHLNQVIYSQIMLTLYIILEINILKVIL